MRHLAKKQGWLILQRSRAHMGWRLHHSSRFGSYLSPSSTYSNEVCLLFKMKLIHALTVTVWVNLKDICFTCACSSAYDTERQIKVAIKKLARPFQSPVHAKRAYREIRMLKHMHHENVSCVLFRWNLCNVIYWKILLFYQHAFFYWAW